MHCMSIIIMVFCMVDRFCLLFRVRVLVGVVWIDIDVVQAHRSISGRLAGEERDGHGTGDEGHSEDCSHVKSSE